jgi:hypothetical protein
MLLDTLYMMDAVWKKGSRVNTSYEAVLTAAHEAERHPEERRCCGGRAQPTEWHASWAALGQCDDTGTVKMAGVQDGAEKTAADGALTPRLE